MRSLDFLMSHHVGLLYVANFVVTHILFIPSFLSSTIVMKSGIFYLEEAVYAPEDL